MIDFSAPYKRNDFLVFLENFLPDDFIEDEYEFENLSFTARYTINVTQLGTCRSMELDVFEVTHTSSHDARVGIAQDAFRLMLHHSYFNRALVIFKQEGSSQYRFSLLQIEAEQADNSSRITRSFSNPRRYSFLMGEGAHVKTPNQFLLEKGKLTLKDGSYFNDLQERFSVETLTKLFYKELSDWYFWALKQVKFPNSIDDRSDDLKYNPENVIRLITRLIFVWFLKQKDLIKPELFDVNKLGEILKDFNPTSTKQDNYYRAILQNLFFATLNQEIEKRGFAEDKSQPINRSTYNIKNLYRYENEYANKDTSEIMKLFSQIPFLNGGLFECLDNKLKDDKTFYWDGFSRRKDRQAYIPNFLFFSDEQTVDLSSEYNNTRMRSVKVTGIIQILEKYNFTIEENTPIEIQVALDPELLGKVFENLLGAYNPETQETARNQTGSFYTPREIVNFMVDESLVAYYQTKVPDISEKSLRQLFEYEVQKVELTEKQRENLIKATFECKILDPACGSGAFPMGILQQMVHVLGKLDPDNKYWQNIIIEQSLKEFDKTNDESNENRDEQLEEIYKTFDQNVNHPDYARKLYLIENCIYGVDIQSVASQISKLRFFISLICEQKQTNDVASNFGIRPLPNLETKFVAGNTLISIEKAEEDMHYIKHDRIKKLIEKLQDIRHKQFSVTRVTKKAALRERDEKVREEIVNEVQQLYIRHADENLEAYKKELDRCKYELDLLSKTSEHNITTTETDLFGNKTEITYNPTEAKRKDLSQRIKRLQATVDKGSDYSRLNSVVKLAKQLTSWNPYDQNTSSPFFDPEWMFGITDGFDIVIGNPPYVQLQNNGGALAQQYANCGYETFARTGDIYCLFYERGWQLLKENGKLCYITSNKWMRAGYGEATRKFFAENTNPLQLIDFGGVKVFESATVDTNILLFAKENNTFNTKACVVKDKELKNLRVYFRQEATEISFSGGESWVVLSLIERQIKEKIERIGTPLKDWDIQINYGIKTGFNEAFIINGEKRKELIEKDPKSEEIIRPILRGRDIKRYGYEFADLYLINTHNGIREKGIKPINIENYPSVKAHLDNYYPQLERRQDKGDTPYNLRNCAYIEDFYKQKIVYPETTQSANFVIDNNEMFIDKTCFMLISKHTNYIHKILSSKLFEIAYKRIFSSVEIGLNGYQYNKHALIKLPLIKDEKTIKSIEYFDNSEYLDQFIYNLYDLSSEEIAFIENRGFL